MRFPPYADGDEIREGQIYRRILPDAGHFVEGKPTFAVFRPRWIDRGKLSALLKGYVSVDDAATKHRAREAHNFGLCEIDISRARQATSDLFRVFYSPTGGPLGHAHVVAQGCNLEEVQSMLAELAEVALPPKLKD